MNTLAVQDHLTSMSTQLIGLSEVFRILRENNTPVRPELYEFLAWTVERLGMECTECAEDLSNKMQ